MSDRLKGFLWVYFFISLIMIFGLIQFNIRWSKKIDNLQSENTELKNENQHLSLTLSETRDSLKYATSEDILWLSRILYTETAKPSEMYYIAHVVKNRVETCYNGKCSYKTVALDPYEFSAFNPSRDLRWYYKNVNRHSAFHPGKWAAAKQVSLDVYMSKYDPTHGATHFFAQVGMPDHRFPHWTKHGEQVKIANNIDEQRLRVYKNVR